MRYRVFLFKISEIGGAYWLYPDGNVYLYRNSSWCRLSLESILHMLHDCQSDGRIHAVGEPLREIFPYAKMKYSIFDDIDDPRFAGTNPEEFQ